MKKAWFENPDNVVYADIDEFADNFGKETGRENKGRGKEGRWIPIECWG